MSAKRLNESNMDQLIDNINQIELLIEDNNQNIKDCVKTLKFIKKELIKNKIPFHKKIINMILRR